MTSVNNGFYYYNKTSNRLKHYNLWDIDTTIKSRENNTVSARLVDKNNNVWITLTSGVFCFNPTTEKFHHYATGKALNTNAKILNSFDIAQDKSNHYWITTKESGLFELIIKDKKETLYNYTKTNSGNLPTDYCYKLVCDQKGYLWIGTLTGLVKFNPKTRNTQAVYTQQNGLHNTNIDVTMSLQKNGDLIVNNYATLSIINTLFFKTNNKKQKVIIDNIRNFYRALIYYSIKLHNMKIKLLAILLLTFLQTIAQPTVTITLATGQTNPTSKPIAYFNVTFSEPVAGFTESDITLTGSTSGAGNAFILSSPIIQTQNFKIGVDSMFTNGSIQINIPANSAASLNDGLGNLPSVVSINYVVPLEIFSTNVGNVLNYAQNVQYTQIIFSPISSCEFTKHSYLSEATSSDHKALRYLNNTNFGVCVGVTVGKDFSPTRFNIFKDNLPTDVASTIANWVGGSDDNNATPFVFGGRYFTSSYAFIAPGQTFYVMAETNSSDFWITISGLPQSSLNYLANEKFDSQSKFTISPNPSNGFFNITSEGNIENVSVYNALGQRVFQGNQTQIDISNKPKGIYFVEVVANNHKSNQKIILN